MTRCLHLHLSQLVHGQLLKECLLFSQALCIEEAVNLTSVDGLVEDVTHFLAIPLESSQFTHPFFNHPLTTVPEFLVEKS